MSETSAPRLYGRLFTRADLVVIGLSLGLAAVAGITHAVPAGTVLPFLASAGAVAVLASLVGRSVEQLGASRLLPRPRPP